MRAEALSARLILACLVLGSAGIVAAQSDNSSAASSGNASSTSGSGGSGSTNSSSVNNTSVSAATGSGLGNISANASISSVSTASGSGSAKSSGGKSSASAGGWGAETSMAGTSSSLPGWAAGSGFAHESAKTSSKGPGSHLGEGTVAASSGPRSAVTSSPAGQAKVRNALPGMSAGQLSRSAQRQEESQAPQGGGGSAGGSYSSDFPDSTKNTALISPPDSADHPIFKFDPTLSFEWPNLSDREFLVPTLHVGGGSSGSGNKQQDVYQRIEERIRGYHTTSRKGKHGSGTKSTNPRSGSSSTSTNPFGRNPAGKEGSAKGSTTSKVSF